MKRDGGIEQLNDDDKEAASNLFDQLSEYGLFAIKLNSLTPYLEHKLGGY